MKRNWENIKWIFEPDGGLRDIYIQEVLLSDWIKLIDFLNGNHSLKYTTSIKSSDKIDKEYIIKYLQDKSGELESVKVTVELDGISANCHFFLQDQIEFDIDPIEIKTIDDYEKVENFMSSISYLLEKQVTLTFENDIKLPVIKIDVIKKIRRILSEDEIKNIDKNEVSFINKIYEIRTNVLLRFFPKLFKKRLIKSALEPYKSTKLNENHW